MVFILVIDADALLENQLNAFLPNTMTEMDKFGCLARWLCRELRHAAEVLIVGILTPLLNYALIRHISDMLQYEQSYHQTYRLGRSPSILAEQWLKGIVEHLPVNLAGKSEQWMCLIQHLCQTTEQRGCLIGFGTC